jgi:hypothetical protein
MSFTTQKKGRQAGSRRAGPNTQTRKIRRYASRGRRKNEITVHQRSDAVEEKPSSKVFGLQRDREGDIVSVRTSKRHFRDTYPFGH